MERKGLIKFPLSLLRAGTSNLSAIDAILWTAVRNAGIGFRAQREEIEFLALCDQGEELWTKGTSNLDEDVRETVSAGAALLGLDRLPSGLVIQNALEDAARLRETPFLYLKREFLWALLREYPNFGRPDLPEGEVAGRRLNWREFRVLCAIISSKTNRHGFTFLGWESISARASGFASKGEAREMAGRVSGLPQHAELLSRGKIVATVDKLEALNFFMRFRYARGPRGGYTAYSIRHAKRDELAKAVIEWADYKSNTVADNRRADQELCRRLSPRRNQ
jgi:hypothetical protein